MKKLLSIFFCIAIFSACTAQEKPTGVAKTIELNKNKKKEYLITITTKFGDIHAILFDDTPQHKMNFIALAQEKYFDSTTFHRVINNFMIQGGDPNSKDKDVRNDGMGGPNYTIPAEISHRHTYGAIAGARKADFMNPKRASSGSQFYIVQNHEGTPHLDNQYSVFGQVIKGLDIVDKIAVVQKGGNDRPIENIYITVKVELLKKKKITKLTGYEFKKL